MPLFDFTDDHPAAARPDNEAGVLTVGDVVLPWTDSTYGPHTAHKPRPCMHFNVANFKLENGWMISLSWLAHDLEGHLAQFPDRPDAHFVDLYETYYRRWGPVGDTATAEVWADKSWLRPEPEVYPHKWQARRIDVNTLLATVEVISETQGRPSPPWLNTNEGRRNMGTLRRL
jgi:hypothetical protein